jgi:sec-independent protein translocase protein TatA
MAVEITPLFAVPGGMELVVVLLIAVLLFGANKIPKLARSTGEAMGEFQKGREEVEQELQEIREGADVDTDIDTDIDTDLDTDPSTSTSSVDTDTETETETEK